VSERRHLLSLSDLDAEALDRLLQRALRYKRAGSPPVLAGLTLALVFQKPSLRTRVSFTVGMTQLGGQAIYLSEAEVGLGTREPVADIARVLSRYVDGIVARVNAHRDLELLARWASVPVINALSDQEHPCQVLADLLTVLEQKGRLAGVSLAYVGDGFNIAHSLLLGAALSGLHLRLATPPTHAPSAEVVQAAQALALRYETGGQVSWTPDPREAVSGAEFVYTDVWTSMGQESESEHRRQAFAGYQVNEELLSLARPGARVLHDMPVHRGEEIEAEVIDGPASLIFDQAENRLHAQKALLVELLGREEPLAR